MIIYHSIFRKKSEYCYGQIIPIEGINQTPMFEKFCRISQMRKDRKLHKNHQSTKDSLKPLNLP
jgi:hypothetical protein